MSRAEDFVFGALIGGAVIGTVAAAAFISARQATLPHIVATRNDASCSGGIVTFTSLLVNDSSIGGFATVEFILDGSVLGTNTYFVPANSSTGTGLVSITFTSACSSFDIVVTMVTV